MDERQNWYIEYDYKTFEILRENDFGNTIYSVC